MDKIAAFGDADEIFYTIIALFMTGISTFVSLSNTKVFFTGAFTPSKISITPF